MEKKTELSIHLLRLIRNLFVIYLDWTGSSSPEQQQHTQKYLLTNSHLANAHYSVHCSVNKWLAGFFELPRFGLPKFLGCLELKWV